MIYFLCICTCTCTCICIRIRMCICICEHICTIYIYTYKYLQSSLFIIPNPPQEPLHKYHVPVFVRSGHCLVQRWRARRSTGAMATDPYTIVCYGQPAKGHLDQPRILSKTNQSLEHVFFFNRKTMENSESQQEISISKIRNPLHAWEASTIFVPFTIQ